LQDFKLNDALPTNPKSSKNDIIEVVKRNENKRFTVSSPHTKEIFNEKPNFQEIQDRRIAVKNLEPNSIIFKVTI
jgi:hypothetical protein